MSTRLMLQVVEAVNRTPADAITRIDVDVPDDVQAIERWCRATGNSVLTVLPDAVEVLRGQIADPIAALPADRRPGYRLWVYTNFHCNLACDYCCACSSPRAEPRIIGVEEFAGIVEQAARAGVRELYLTGGEPFLLADIDQRLRLAASVLPTTVLTNGMLWRGDRLRRLESLPRDGLTLQISLDAATPALHDRHRGAGSFARTLAGIHTALDLGFRVRIAATLGGDAPADTEAALGEFFDRLGLRADQRVVRRVARQGAANGGLVVSRASLIPEVCITAHGVYWHPVAATDPAMKMAAAWAPLEQTIAAASDEYRGYRITGAVLASTFPCV